MQTSEHLTVEAVEAAAAKAGIALTAEDYAIADQAAAARRQTLESEAAQSARQKDGRAAWVDRFNTLFPRLIKALIAAGDVAMAVIQAVIIAIGAPVTLALLMVVEQQRLLHGIGLFEIHGTLAALSAWGLVQLNLILEFLIAHTERRAGWVEPPKHVFSFRILARRLAYTFGAGGATWAERQTSPAQRFRAGLKLVTAAILILAFAGSMTPLIKAANGQWLEALWGVFTNSTLLEFSTWGGGLIFTLAVVVCAQILARYVSERVSEVQGVLEGEGRKDAAAFASAIGATRAAVLLARLKERQAERRAAARQTPAPVMGGGGMPEGYILVKAAEGHQQPAEGEAAAPSYQGYQAFSVNPDRVGGEGMTGHQQPAAEGEGYQGYQALPDKPIKPEKLSPALAKAVQWLIDNPEYQDKSLSAMIAASGMTQATLSRARAWLRGNGGQAH